MVNLTILFGLLTAIGISIYFWLDTKSGQKWLIGNNSKTKQPSKSKDNLHTIVQGG